MNRRCDGFTLAEALVALLIVLSLLGGTARMIRRQGLQEDRMAARLQSALGSVSWMATHHASIPTVQPTQTAPVAARTPEEFAWEWATESGARSDRFFVRIPKTDASRE